MEKKLNFKVLGILLTLILPGHTWASNASDDNNWFGYLDEGTITAAKNRASQTNLNFNNYIDSTEQNFPWITLKDVSYVNPKSHQEEQFIIVNICRKSSPYGEFALYHGKTDPSRIRLSGLTGFTDFGKETALYLSTITYQYFTQEKDEKGYIVIEKVDAGFQAGGKGYAQVCLKAFLNHFISPQTSVEYVFSDLRAAATQHYFSKYGFQKGLPDDYKTLTTKMVKPYYYHK